MKSNAHSARQHALARLKARLLNIRTALVVLWVLTLVWGERLVFQRSTDRCAWQSWESWPAHARPHRVLLVADPQLVDPHTYPGRPWPLSTLTTLYTDLYLRRSYRLLQDDLRPDATLFLGDLFDGGREWGTVASSSPEERYKRFGADFWLKEYVRFSDIFLRRWFQAPGAGRRLLASVPGNHDLGFASGIQEAVKNRFDAYFGPLNRVDIIGNHSFVALDTVSLSAMDQVDPATGRSGAGDGSGPSTAAGRIWSPVEEFLIGAKEARARAVRHACEHQFGWVSPGPAPFPADVLRPSDPETRRSPSTTPSRAPAISTAQFPTIVLSHVPLYRTGSTSCGPLRERGTAIPLQAGYQYQNALTPLVSADIVKHLSAEEITMIYSGDDHDYCEIEHSEFTGRIREITVKSMSWAMGVRLPGVQLVSLWNPVDVERVMNGGNGDNGDAASAPAMPRDTVQNKLCLLPDQLSIFVRYAQVLGLTLVVLAVHALRHNPNAESGGGGKPTPLLPLTRTPPRTESVSETSCVSNASNISTLATRGARHYGGYRQHVPAAARAPSPSKLKAEYADGTDDWGVPVSTINARHRAARRRRGRIATLGHNVLHTAWPVGLFYLWLIWRG